MTGFDHNGMEMAGIYQLPNGEWCATVLPSTEGEDYRSLIGLHTLEEAQAWCDMQINAGKAH